MIELNVIAIDPARLDAIRAAGADEQGNPLRPEPAHGWEPLRCCLRLAERGEQVALISYAHVTDPSPWREVGPVFVHAEACKGYPDPAAFPEAFRTGPRLLRTYHADGSLDYADITLVPAGADVAEAVAELLSRPHVDEVHARAAEAQCFTFAIRAAR
jgi:hypothetical protein